jgi:hypothetical protein
VIQIISRWMRGLLLPRLVAGEVGVDGVDGVALDREVAKEREDHEARSARNNLAGPR